MIVYFALYDCILLALIIYGYVDSWSANELGAEVTSVPNMFGTAKQCPEFD